VQARHDRDRGPGLDRGNARLVEGVALDEARDAVEPLLADHGGAVAHVDVAVVAQQDRFRARLQPVDGLEHVAAMPGRDVRDAHRTPRRPQAPGGDADGLPDVLLAHAYAAPADRIEVIAIDETADQGGAAGA